MSTTVILLGAGFSKNFGLPLVGEIFPTGFAKLTARYPEFRTKFPLEWMRLIGGRPYECMNYEEMLSRLDMELNYAVAHSEPHAYVYALWHLRDSVVQIFWESVRKDLSQTESHAIRKFLGRCQNPSSIISFNQDLMLETYLENNSVRWSYGFPESKFTYRDCKGRVDKPEVHFLNSCDSSDGIRRNSPTFGNYENQKPQFTLLKPHGSFNWQFCPRCHDVQIIPLDEAGATGRPFAPIEGAKRLCAKPSCIASAGAQTVYANLIIPPTVFKQLDSPLLRKVWLEARNRLRSASELHIIGYSFSHMDALAGWMFFEALDANRDLSRIVVVDPNGSAVERLQSLLRDGLESKLSHFDSFDGYLK